MSRKIVTPLLPLFFLVLGTYLPAATVFPISSSSPPPPNIGETVASTPHLFADLAEKVVPSVVNIATTSKRRPDRNPGDLEQRFRRDFERFFGEGFGISPRSSAPPLRALGTGVVIGAEGKKGLILTNHHVIADAGSIQIQFSDGLGEKPVEGKLVATDRDLDLALIEVRTARELTPLPLGDSTALRVGEFVMAVGNPFGQGHSVSHGIISAKGRTTPMILGRYLQTDAPINPGNSGGPLVNLKGEIIGINNAILAQAQGIGFAIPSNEIQRVLPELREKGKVTRGYIGVRMAPITQEVASFVGGKIAPGVPYIAALDPDGPAEKAGLRPNDVIIGFDGKPVRSPDDLLFQVTATPVGKEAKLEILRNGEKRTLPIKIAPRPS